MHVVSSARSCLMTQQLMEAQVEDLQSGPACWQPGGWGCGGVGVGAVWNINKGLTSAVKV